MSFDTFAYFSSLPKLLAVSWITIAITLASMVLALCGGILLTWLRALKWPPLSLLIAAVRSIVFGVPLLVIILIAYYVLPAAGINLSPSVAGTLAIGICSAFFTSEIFRGGLAVVPGGQIEAAAALGLGAAPVWLRIILPQMLRASIPPLVNEFTILLKATALLSVITVTDVMRTAQQIYAVTYQPFETLLAAATIYIGINLVASRVGRLFESAERRAG